MADVAGTDIHVHNDCASARAYGSLLAECISKHALRDTRTENKHGLLVVGCCCCCRAVFRRYSVPYVEVPVLVQPTRTSFMVTS